MSEFMAKIQMNGKNAEVRIGENQLVVTGGQNPDRAMACPIELITAALGS